MARIHAHIRICKKLDEVSVYLLGKEVMFSVVLVCLSLCLSVSEITSKSYECFAMNYYGVVQGGKRRM